MTDGWGFLVYVTILANLIWLIAVNAITILILLIYSHRIRKYINQYFIFFCLGSIFGCALGSVFGNALGSILHIILSGNILYVVDVSSLILIFYSPFKAIVFTSPIFVVLSLIIYYKNIHSVIIPSSKTRSFTFSFLFFSILCFAVFCVTGII